MADVIGRILDKGGAVVNVQHPDFGAQGNFTGDAGLAIQNAIDGVLCDSPDAKFYSWNLCPELDQLVAALKVGE